jgi:hypothetical protein
MRIRCIVYKNEFSAGRSAWNDLHLGHVHHVVGCGSKWMDRAAQGDLVLICAKKECDMYCIIVALKERLGSCTVWADAGGLTWAYNWTYTPLTSLFMYTDEMKASIVTLCELRGLKYKNIFHPRFCSEKLKEPIEKLVFIAH